MLPNAAANYLSGFFSRPIDAIQISPVRGGSINQTFRLQLPHKKTFFCKVNSATKFPHLFEREQNGLSAIAATSAIKTPEVMSSAIVDLYQILILEWIDSGERTDDFWKTFGKQLAALHGESSGCYGFQEDNYMGSVPQVNGMMEEWTSFFIQQRLQPLIKHCSDKHLLPAVDASLFEQIFLKLPSIFSTEKPALLHGDLWSGNFMCNQNSEPVLIDPAVYYGHRSVDLGMTTLFGGFNKSFYEAYHYHYPLPKNYEEQWEVCNLYPLLIHLLLFGRSYLAQIETILKRYQ